MRRPTTYLRTTPLSKYLEFERISFNNAHDFALYVYTVFSCKCAERFRFIYGVPAKKLFTELENSARDYGDEFPSWWSKSVELEKRKIKRAPRVGITKLEKPTTSNPKGNLFLTL